ncbi:AMP-binding protein [Variovorax sp. PCZ-1]|uniref:acyl-CoA synthetase n=1 Tax=Variovorax sp. PCZ-1 TaxID=2835533 RepID=UPI001BCE11CA|nr:AMP-binding protein [Variovorax sp. PCZ-1]MBS7806891.1 AMP-binding protein [Variovorax sp. PCZ-1]
MPATKAPLNSYAAIHKQFRWHVPAQFNMAQECVRRWADNPDTMKNIAVRAHSMPGRSQKHHEIMSYEQLAAQANQLSHLLKNQGVKRGDRVAIVLPQRLETAVAYMAVLQMGAVAMPLSMLFGAEALEYRFIDSAAVVAIVDESTILAVRDARKSCPALRCVIGMGDAAEHCDIDYALATLMQPAQFPLVKTRADEAAVLIYTSGTTGPAKGALIPHRALLGNLTGFVASQNWFGFDGRSNAKSDAVFWSPADWAWTGGLMDALLPTLYFGREIIAFNGRFSPEIAFEILQNHRVSHTFLFPTALKAMMKAFPEPKRKFKLRLQALMSAGEAVGDAVYDWCEHQLGVKVNEMFGQTEINYVVGNCNKFWPSKPGSMGKGYPGHQVAVINEASETCKAGEIGEVAVNHLDVHGKPDPVFFLGYWNNESATKKKTTVSADGQRWCRTGDLAFADVDGYLWYQGRADDMFKAAGYRIGPGEVENCLLKHPAVLNAAVVPKPDAERGALVKAYVVLAPEIVALRAGFMPANDIKGLKNHDDNLIQSIQQHVRGLLAPYEYPKEIEFINALPMTTTGKVQRRVLRLQEEERFKERAQ